MVHVLEFVKHFKNVRSQTDSYESNHVCFDLWWPLKQLCKIPFIKNNVCIDYAIQCIMNKPAADIVPPTFFILNFDTTDADLGNKSPGVYVMMSLCSYA